jgi:hypothetical protein
VVEESQLDHLLGACMFGRRKYGTVGEILNAKADALLKAREQ